MEITHLGHSAFKMQGKHVTLVTDPYKEDLVGLKFPKVTADIVTVSHQHDDHNFIGGISGNPIIVAGPGEYEIKGVRIIGIASYHDAAKGSQRGKNTIYHFVIGGVSIVHCGDLGDKLDDNAIDRLDNVDLLMIPVGGFYTISAKEAAEIIYRLEPKVVIPMHYHTPKLNQDNFGKMASVDIFLKEMGREGIQPQAKLTISKDKLPVETTVVVFE